MTPREIWFKNRIDECLLELEKVNKLQDWNEFKNQAHTVASEILYATSEWDNYYKYEKRE